MNSVDGAFFGAKTALPALFGIDRINHKVFADVRGATFVHDVRDVFVSEVSKRGKDRVGSGLTESAERVASYVRGEFFKRVQIVHSRFSVDDFGEKFEHSLRSDTAGRAFSAGFVVNEFHIEFRNVYHTVVFVHDDRAARAHHRAFGDEVIEIDFRVQIGFRKASAGRTARLNGFEFFTVRYSAADIVNKFA